MSLPEPLSGHCPPERTAGASRWRAARRVWRIAVVGALFAVFAFPLAGLAGNHEERRDHDQARQALLAGKVLPLRTVLETVEQNYPGDPVKIEFEHDNDTYVYEIKVLQAEGTIVKLKIDATTGQVLSAKSREHTHEKDD
jgi:hypothetical protein